MPWSRFHLAFVTAFFAFAFVSCTNSPYRAELDDRKVFYQYFDDPPKSLDPAKAGSVVDHEITSKVYNTLLEFHYLKRPFTLIPGLASAVPTAEPLPDGRTRYRFTLRSDLIFQDDPCFELGGAGRRTRAITSADQAFSIMRLGDPLVDSPMAEPFSNILGFRDFVARLVARRKSDPEFAKQPALRQYQAVGGIEGITTPSPTEFDVVMATPYPQILYWFAHDFTSPLAWEAVTYYDGKEGRPHLRDHPVGTGPFRLVHYDKESRIVLVKDPNWYGARHPEWKAPGAVYPSEGEPGDVEAGRLRPEAVGQPLPFLERIEYRRERENIPRFNKFMQGYYDLSAIIKESFERIVQGGTLSPEMSARGMRLNKSVLPDVFWIGFNMEDPTVGAARGEQSRKVRQAMSLAVDAGEFTRLFLNGRGIPAESLLPPGLFGYDAAYKSAFRTVDLDRARALLAEAGYRNGVDPATGKPLHLTFDTGDTSADGRLKYQFFIDEWRQLGIDVELAATNFNQFQDKVRRGAYQIYLWGWVADYPDPENFMFLFSSDMRRSIQGGPNTSNYANAEYDDLLAQMKPLNNDADRMAIIRRMVAILERDRPLIELYFPESYMLTHAWVKNVKPVPGLLVDKYYDVVPTERTALRAAWNKPVLWPLYALLGLFGLIVVPGIRTFFRERQ